VSRAIRSLLVAAAGAATAGAVRRRRSRRTRVGLYFSDGLLIALPPASPAALRLRAAVGEVLRAFSPTASPQPPDPAS
jgi:hypothetical protein